MFGAWCSDNKWKCAGLIILIILVISWYFGSLKLELSVGATQENAVAYPSFQAAVDSKYADVTRDSKGMTAVDWQLERGFENGQFT